METDAPPHFLERILPRFNTDRKLNVLWQIAREIRRRPGKRKRVGAKDSARQVGYRPEHGQERFRPLAVSEGCRALGDFGEGQPGALEVLQERREQSRERVDPALLFEDSM